MKALVVFGVLSTVLLYNPSKFSYWDFVIVHQRIDWSGIWTFQPETLSSWLWLMLGIVMVWAATWLFFKAWRALVGWHDKFFAVLAAAMTNVIFVVAGFRQHLIDDPINAVYLVYIAVIVIDLYAMFTKRGELGIFRTRTIEPAEGDLDTAD